MPYAVFGQHSHNIGIQQIGIEARHYIEEKWPKAQNSIENNIPKTIQTMGTTLDALNPSSGARALQEKPHPWLV